MAETYSTDSTPHGEWVARCTARIRSLDDAITELDANELSQALWERGSCRAIGPDAAAIKLLERNLDSSRWAQP